MKSKPSICVYEAAVEVDNEFDINIKNCFVQHLTLYNFALGLSFDNPEIGFKEKKKLVIEYIEKNGIKDIAKEALFNELYYQHKKFNGNNRGQKRLIDIQYLTFLDTGYYVNHENKTMTIRGIQGKINIIVPLDKNIISMTGKYVNFSYSSNTNKYMLKIFTNA